MRAIASHHRRGYVLVVTLGLLVLSITLLVAVGRMAVGRALLAREAGEDFQRRWAAASCRSAVLPYAEQVLVRVESRQRRAVPVYRINVQLGRQRVGLVISDEQAKANVNSLLEWERLDRTAVESRLRGSFSGAGLAGQIRLRPVGLASDKSGRRAAATTQPAGVPQWVGGLGQVFDGLPPARLLAGAAPPAERITCWGPGGVNLARASEPTLLLAAPSLSQLDVGRLMDVRKAHFSRQPTAHEISSTPLSQTSRPPRESDPVSALLAEARVTLKDRAKVALTVGSTCHSLWIITGDDRRAWYELDVSDETDPAHPRTEAFVW